MDKFLEAENIGRNNFKSWLEAIGVTDYEFTEDSYDPVDCNFTFKGYNITSEIKVRDIKYKDYPTHFMELSKYKAMTKYLRDNNKDLGLYANFFGDCWLYTYQLQNIDIVNTSQINLVATTVSDNGYKNKDIIEIPVDVANIYYRENKESKWTKL